MADIRRNIDAPIDVENSVRRKLGGSVFYNADQLDLFRGTQILFRFQLLYADATTPYVPESTAVFLFGIDDVYTLDHADLVVSDNSQFNIGIGTASADWDEANLSNGKISCRVDMTSAALKTALGSSASSIMHAALWMCPLGGRYTLLCQFDVTVKNIAVDPTTATVQEGVSYPTMDLYDADLAQINTPTGGLYRLKNGALQIKNSDTGLFHTMSLSGAAGSETLSYGPGEA